MSGTKTEINEHWMCNDKTSTLNRFYTEQKLALDLFSLFKW